MYFTSNSWRRNLYQAYLSQWGRSESVSVQSNGTAKAYKFTYNTLNLTHLFSLQHRPTPVTFLGSLSIERVKWKSLSAVGPVPQLWQGCLILLWLLFFPELRWQALEKRYSAPANWQRCNDTTLQCMSLTKLKLFPFGVCRKRMEKRSKRKRKKTRKKQMKRKWKCEKVRCLKIQAVKTQSHSLVMCEQELPKFVAHACTVLGAAGCEGSYRTTQDFVNTRATVTVCRLFPKQLSS